MGFKSSVGILEQKQPRTRRRHLLALGVNPKKVNMATRRRKGCWRMSQTEYRGAEWTGADATCPAGGRAVRRRASNCAIRAQQQLAGGTRGSRHGRAFVLFFTTPCKFGEFSWNSPCTEPYAGWCGTGELITPRDPIRYLIFRIALARPPLLRPLIYSPPSSAVRII